MNTATATAKTRIHAVRIERAGNKLTYMDPATGASATTVKVHKGEAIHWQCAGGNFSVLFKRQSPFAETGFSARQGTPTKDAVVTGLKGSYKYAVMVIPPNGHPIVDDPEVIVADDE